MSLADGALPLIVPPDPAPVPERAPENGGGRVRWGAIAVAALLHAAIVAALLIRWPVAVPALPPPAIPVTLVSVLPPPQPAPPQPKPPETPLAERRSGADEVTTAPPKEADKGEDAAPAPAPPPAPTASVPAEKPRPETPPKAAAKPKVAARETAPEAPKHSAMDRAVGDTEKTGDPYLNALWGMIERHRAYPANAVGSYGLRLEGTAVFLIAVMPDGSLHNIELQRSAGAPVLDETARKMIEEAAPFPPLPPGYPGGGVVLSVTIHIFPGAG